MSRYSGSITQDTPEISGVLSGDGGRTGQVASGIIAGIIETGDRQIARVEQAAESVLNSVSATATTLPESSPATVSYSNKTFRFGIPKGSKGDPGTPGDPGQNGISPTISVTDILDGHRVTITDTFGTKTFDVMNGPVQDVTVDGTSILNNEGVAEIPLGTDSEYGVVMLNPDAGITQSAATGKLLINNATNSQVREGSDAYRPITPGNQDQAAFYGLAKAAGDTTQSQSNNAVGTYTDEAKAAIKTMLGVTDPEVSDVQVNGASIVNNGVADIPVASTSKFGSVKLQNNRGISINDSGCLYINTGSVDDIKPGTNNYRAIVPSNQHMSTFYGLAKAAGDETQSASNNAVGNYTDTAKAAIKSMLGVEDPEVEDVQINGTSILEAGVANIPIASASSPGVVKVDSANGIGFDSNNKLLLRRSSIDNCRLGSGNMMAVTPWSQHYAAFYGLAKAAGVDLASTSSAQFGTYTDEAKIAIQKMLGVYREWELIADVTVAEDTIQLNILTDLNGQSFALSNMLVRAWLEPATTGNNSYVGSGILVVNTDNVDTTVGGTTKRYMTNGAKTYFEYATDLMCGVCITSGRSASGATSTSTVESISSTSDNIKYIRGFRLYRYSDTTSLIPAGSNIKIYGIRI